MSLGGFGIKQAFDLAYYKYDRDNSGFLEPAEFTAFLN